MLQAGRVVRSIAGRDKDRFYVVVSAGQLRVAIADGKVHRLEKPKAKNPLHLRLTATVLDLTVVTTDKKLRKALGALGAEGEEGGS